MMKIHQTDYSLEDMREGKPLRPQPTLGSIYQFPVKI
jgi:hypothetical protein